MSNEKIHNTILELFRSKPILAGVSEEEDFFDLGVSSLTVVELQVLVEEALGTKIATAKLMAAPTIKEWIEIYTAEAA